MSDLGLCHGLTKSGRPCSNYSSRWFGGVGYCHLHGPNDPLPALIPTEAPGPDVPTRRRVERAIVRGLKYIGGFKHQAQVGRPDGSITLIAYNDPDRDDTDVTVWAREGRHVVVCLDDVLDRLRDHGAFEHGAHAANYIEKERREGRL